MMTRILVASAACISMAACSSITPAVDAGVTTAEADFAKAVTAYDTAKIAASLLAASDPSLAPTIATIESKVDPLVAEAQAAEAAAAIDAPQIEALVAQINSQVASLNLSSAKAVRMAASRG